MDIKHPKLRLEGVSKDFVSTDNRSLPVLDHIHLSIPTTGIASLVGPSGCGKTTLLKIVVGLIEPTGGRVYIDGEQIVGHSRKCGYVPQAYTLFPWLTVEENIQFGMRIRGWSQRRRDDAVEDFLAITGLGDYRTFYPKSLSGGMQQRVAIARALAIEPELLLLDEPFGALDTQTRALMQENLLLVWERTRRTILLVTHDIEEAIFVSDVVYVSTARPASVKADVPIELDRPRDHLVKQSMDFMTIKNKITNFIREESLRAI